MNLSTIISSSIFFASFLVLRVIPTDPIVGGLLALTNLFSLAGMIACLSVLVIVHHALLTQKCQVAYNVVSRRRSIASK